MIEGYEPPRDPRLNHFSVTPDPGVIEVNVHPSHDWGELVERTDFLYDAARATAWAPRNSCSMAATPAPAAAITSCSAAPRPPTRPSCAARTCSRSLLAYWHNHPSLSYLFSGLFIGPTSQAPRVDEARNDSLYELEIALQQMPPPDAAVPPWLVDRLLRNLLIDVTGNTHRAEFCIDKLYSPDGPDRPAGPAGAARLRDAAARAHEPDAAAAAALAGRALLEDAVSAAAPGALGNRAARSLHAAVLRRAGFPRRDRRAARAGYALEQPGLRRISNFAFRAR